MKDLHTIAQERQAVEGEIKSLRNQITNGEQALADKRQRLQAELDKLAALKADALAVFEKTESAGLPEAPATVSEMETVGLTDNGEHYAFANGKAYDLSSGVAQEIDLPADPFQAFGHPLQNGDDTKLNAAFERAVTP